MKTKAIFATDIDNTLTDERLLIPDSVAIYIIGLYERGWEIIFVTGRTFSFAYRSLEKFSFPYHLFVQHGAEVLEMPQKRVLSRHFLSMDVVRALSKMCEFIVYAGYERGDFCYYRKKQFTPEMQNYLKELELKASMPWEDIDSWDQIDQKEFPLIKCIGTKEDLLVVQAKIHQTEQVTSSLIRDTINPSYYLLLITHFEACKGKAVSSFLKKQGWNGPLVTAGDDNNDIELLKLGTIKIAMETGPEALKMHADIIAKSSHEMGIIKAMDEAIERLGM